MSEQKAEKETLTDAERERWRALAEADGWDDINPAALFHRAVEAVAWELIEQASDTTDRDPSVETMNEAYATARRLLATLNLPPERTATDG